MRTMRWLTGVAAWAFGRGRAKADGRKSCGRCHGWLHLTPHGPSARRGFAAAESGQREALAAACKLVCPHSRNGTHDESQPRSWACDHCGAIRSQIETLDAVGAGPDGPSYAAALHDSLRRASAELGALRDRLRRSEANERWSERIGYAQAEADIAAWLRATYSGRTRIADYIERGDHRPGSPTVRRGI